MAELLTPGAYVQPDPRARRIRALRTDVIGFVGLAERGPVDRPIAVESLEQYRSELGGFPPSALLPLAVKAFFENGGRRAWVVRAAADDAAPAAVTLEGARPLDGAPSVPRMRVVARSPGRWARRVAVGVVRSVRASTVTDPVGTTSEVARIGSVSGFRPGTLVRIAQEGTPSELATVDEVDPVQRTIGWRAPVGIDPTREAFLEALVFALTVYEGGAPVESFPDLSVHDVESAVDAHSRRIRVELLGSDPAVLPLPHPPGQPFPLAGGRDGTASLRWADLVGEPGDPRKRGLRALEDVDEVAMIAIPDAMARPHRVNEVLPPAEPGPEPCVPCEPPAPPPRPPVPVVDHELPPGFGEAEIFEIQRAMVQHCETLRDRFALLDVPPGPREDGSLSASQLLSWRARFDTSYAALFHPWAVVKHPTSRVAGETLPVPPSGHVGGLYARTDLRSGVHTPPANAELRWTQGLSADVGDELQGALNPSGINCIRAFPARGIRLYGARTMSSAAAWRYVNVRRLMMMIEEAIEEALQWAVFEPHDIYLRQKLVVVVSTFLRALFRAGALAGATEEESFFVRCDDSINPPRDVADGKLVAIVGVAPVVPAEFIVLRIGRTTDELQIREEGSWPWP